MTGATGAKRGIAAKQQDAQTKAILFEGASLSQLSRLFGRDNRTTAAKLQGLHPVGVRAGSPIYAVKDAAPLLVPPAYDIDEFIRRMTISDLPMQIRKEFWAGMRSKQLYEKEAGDLWPTDQVSEMLTELFKTMKMSLLLTRDTIERETELSDRQRDIVRRIIDGCLRDLNMRVVSHTKQRMAPAPETPASEEDEL